MVRDKHRLEWEEDLWNDREMINGNKLRVYREYKKNPEVEMYLKLGIPHYKRRYFSMLRAGSLPLNVETGRYAKPPLPLHERICTLCDKMHIEDEKHFLMHCPLYSDIREELFERVLEKIPLFCKSSVNDKFCILMSNNDIIYNTIVAVHKMFTRRKNFV